MPATERFSAIVQVYGDGHAPADEEAWQRAEETLRDSWNEMVLASDGTPVTGPEDIEIARVLNLRYGEPEGDALARAYGVVDRIYGVVHGTGWALRDGGNG